MTSRSRTGASSRSVSPSGLARPGRDPGLRRPPGERVRRGRLPLRLERRTTRAPARRCCSRGVTAYQPTFITSAEETTIEAHARDADEWLGPADPRRAPRGAVPLARPARHASARAPARARRRASRPAARRWRRDADDARARAARARTRSSSGCASAASRSRPGTRTRPPLEANHAFDLGVGGVTHVFNAMRPFRSRDPGIAGAALTRRSS